MAVVFSNNAKTTLASTVSTSATSITVADGSVFPALNGSDYTYVTFEDSSGNVEIVKVTALSGNTLTVVRAQDNTSARAFSSGGKCELRLTSAGLNDVTTTTASVTAAGALMDSEISNIEAIKTLNQSVRTVDSVNFGAVNTTGDIETGSKLIFGTHDSELGNNYLQFNANSHAFIGHNVVGKTLSFKISVAAPLDTTPFTLTQYGMTINGTMATTGSITGGGTIKTGNDTGKIMLGTSNDLQIYHDGNHSHLRNATGDLRIRSDGFKIQNYGANSSYMTGVNGGAVSLYFAGVSKVTTTANGVTVTGSLSAAGGSSTNWNAAYGWGNHASAGYLTSYTDTNTTYSIQDGELSQNNFTNADHTKLNGIAANANNYVLPFTNNSTNWNTAYGWGNHASAGYYAASNPNGYTNDQTAAEILTAIKTVDGSGSGLDADLLDGQHGSYYAANSSLNSYMPIRMSTPYAVIPTGGWAGYNLGNGTMLQASSTGLPSGGTHGYWHVTGRRDTSGGYVGLYFQDYSASSGMWIGKSLTSADPTWERVWSAGTDGSGSGLDADLLDGLNSTSFVRSDANDTMNALLTINTTNDAQLSLTSANGWTGISFNDGAARGAEYLWHNGNHGTFALGGGGSDVAGKKLHVDGGLSVGASSDTTATPANGIYSEGNVSANGTTIGADGTYAGYSVTGFGGTTNGYNRVFGHNSNADGLYLAAASGRGIIFRVNGSGANSFAFNSTGHFQLNNTTVIDSSRNLTNIGTISSGVITSTGAITSADFFKATGSNLKFSAGGNHIFNVDLNGKIYPQTHNAVDIGFNNTTAFRNLYLSGTVNSTSGNYTTTTSRNRFTTSSGYIELGPMNATWAHIYTDRANFYFNKNLYVLGSKVWHAGNDGSGSGLDADLLDGQQGSYYYSSANPPPLTADPTLTLTGDVTGSATFTNLGNATLTAVVNNDSHYHSQVYIPDTRGAQRAPSYYNDRYAQWDFQQNTDTLAGGDSWHALQTVAPWSVYNSAHRQQQLAWTGTGGLKFRYATSESAWAGWQTLWTSGNDGSGSGLDADTLDGIQGASFLRSDASDSIAAGTTYTFGTSNAEGFRFTNSSYSKSLYIGGWSGSLNSSGISRIRNSNDNLHIDCGSAGNLYFNHYATGNIYYRGSTLWGAVNDGSGSGLDADTVDGIQGASFLRSDATDYQNNTIYQRGYLVNETAYRNRGVYGNYNSSKTNHIWSMGVAYKNHASGTNFGNLYGLAYKHTNNGTGGTMAGGHQMVWCQNGTGYAAMGSNIWTSGNVTAYSDIRVKENLKVIPNALNKVMQLNGYTYDRTDLSPATTEEEDITYAHNPTGRHVGVIAQEVLKVLPEAVTGGPNSMDGTDDDHYSVAYGNMVALLIESIKELKADVDDLKTQLENK